jgi:hypothetical protein
MKKRDIETTLDKLERVIMEDPDVPDDVRRLPGNLEFMEAQYNLPADGDFQERVERIRLAMLNALERYADRDAAAGYGDAMPRFAEKLRKWSDSELVSFIDATVKNELRKMN